MGKQDRNLKEYYTIDLLHIAKSLLKRLWIIIIAAVLGASAGFSISFFLIAPSYASSIMLYVNNSSASQGNPNFSISSSEISAAQSLVKTYGEILNNRITLERVIAKANVGYTYAELSEMISAAPSNNTEIMKVTVTTGDPDEAAHIANCIAEVLPVRISEIIDGASMEVVDSALPNPDKVSPSITKYTLVGFAIGLLLSVVVLVIVALLDDTIHDEEYVIRTYNYPILAKIPDLLEGGNKQYSYYSQHKHSDHN